MSKEFGNWLKKKRSELGLTQLDLAFKSGLSLGYFVHLELGVHQPSKLDVFVKLGKALGIDPMEIITIYLDILGIRVSNSSIEKRILERFGALLDEKSVKLLLTDEFNAILKRLGHLPEDKQKKILGSIVAMLDIIE